MSFTVPALKPFMGRLVAAQGAVDAGAAAELYKLAEEIMSDSKDRAPVETGNLRSSGHVDSPQVSLGHVRVPLGYDAPYALYVHEGHRIVAWGHDTGRMQPPDKFLLEPMLAAVDKVTGELGGKLGVVITTSLRG